MQNASKVDSLVGVLKEDDVRESAELCVSRFCEEPPVLLWIALDIGYLRLGLPNEGVAKTTGAAVVPRRGLSMSQSKSG